MTEWREVPGFPHYEASSDGGIRRQGRPLRPWMAINGYPTVGLRRDGERKTKTVTVHSIIAITFLGERPHNHDVCHGDGDKTNNALSNLRYDTRSANIKDAVRHGSFPTGSRHHFALLTETKVKDIRGLSAFISPKDLARWYGVKLRTIYSVLSGQNWKGVST